MFLLGFRRKLTALALCKSIESVIQWFQIHHRITFATIQNPAVYLSGARVSIFLPWFPDYIFCRNIGLSIFNILSVLMANQIKRNHFYGHSRVTGAHKNERNKIV